MRIKALIFDFDGLILDTETAELQAWQELFAEHGQELNLDLWADVVGRPRSYFDMYDYFKQLTGSPRTARASTGTDLTPADSPRSCRMRSYGSPTRSEDRVGIELRSRIRVRAFGTFGAIFLLRCDQVFRGHPYA
jgi:hypothetical protein